MGDLTSKIISLIGDIGIIPKTGVNNFHKYEYRKHEDIMKALQPSLVKNGLIIYPKHKKVLFNSVDGKSRHVAIEVIYAITDGEKTIEFTGLGEGIDNGDKAIYKAQTGATKYALNDLLMLASEMDAEAHDVQTKATTTQHNNKPTVQPTPKYEVGTVLLKDKVDLSEQEQIIDLCAALNIKHENKLMKANAIGATKVIEELKNIQKEG